VFSFHVHVSGSIDSTSACTVDSDDMPHHGKVRNKDDIIFGQWAFAVG
jgi:hypothetical protein